MSVILMGLVYNADLPATEKAILLAYADHADHEGNNVYPSIELVAWKTGYSERTVQRMTRNLETAGILEECGQGPNGTNRWRINIDKLPKRAGWKTGVTVCQGDSVSPGGDSVSPQGCQGVTQSVMNHHESSCATGGARESFSVLADVCKIDLDLITQRQRGMLNQTIKVLRDRGITPAEIEAYGAWWYATDWRGKTGQPPTPAQVRETWGQFAASGVGKPTTIKVGR